MGTADNIFVLHGLITHLINQGKKLFYTFIDFKKAFDFINRDIILYKLIKLWVRGKILNVIRSMYENVKSRVKYNNELSNDFDSYLGVRQGECLSPFLFSMYLNDIEDEFFLHGLEGVDIGSLKLFLLLYADDMTIFAETPAGLQKGLDTLKSYCNRWKLTVNIEKTKIIIFRKGGILPRDMRFFYNDQEIEIVKTFSYLGIVFTPGGSFSNAQVTLAGQAQKAVFKLNSCLYSFPDLAPKHVLDLFDKLVSPILSFGSEIWCFCKADKIERVHLQFCKTLLGVKQSTQNSFIYGELGRIPYQIQRYFSIIKYWFKVINKAENKYVNAIYKMMLRDLEINDRKINWAILVRNLLSNLGFFEVWLNQGVWDVKLFLTMLRQRIKYQFIQGWAGEIQNSSRARFYRNITEFHFQPYLDIINIRKFRTAMTKLRVSSHRLEVETGRWTRPVSIPFDERKCHICDRLEDEFHFLFECPFYNELRTQYLSRYFVVRPSMYKLTELFKTEVKKRIKNLSIYIFKAFQLRQNRVYMEM